jgi:hypothetical protein
MKVKMGILLCACILLLPAGVRAQEWRRIKPLRTTRTEVEQLFGKAERSYAVTYELETGNLFVEYSTGPCGSDKRAGWNVPEDTVISYSFSAKNKQRFADFKLDSKKFRKVTDAHVGIIDYYINDEEGIMYEVQGGEVDYVEYYPPRRYNRLYCGDSSAILLRGKTPSP